MWTSASHERLGSSPAAVAATPRLRRRTTNRVVAGVAGGIADRFGMSVVVARVIVVVLMVSPWATWAYAAAALLVPAEGSDRRGWDNLVALARVGVALAVPAVVLSGELVVNDPFDGPTGWWIALAGLLGAGTLAFVTAGYRRDGVDPEAHARRAVLGSLPVALPGAVLAAGMVLAPDVRWERFVALVAISGAVGLLVAARRGNGRPFLAPAILAVAAAALVTASDMRLQGGIGDTRVTPAADPDGHISARRAIGDLELDLRRVGEGGLPATVDASVGVGSLRVLVPRGARVELDVRVRRGRIDPWLMSYRTDPLQGLDRRLRATVQNGTAGRQRMPIRLRAEVAVGQVKIGREPDVLDDGP